MGLFLFFCGKVSIVMYFFVSIRFHIRYSSFASSEVKGVIAPYGRRGVKTTVFLAYFFKQQDIRLNSLTPLTPLTS